MQINILGITYNVQEVECVNRTDPELGEVNFIIQRLMREYIDQNK